MAAKQLRCEVCQERKQPKTRRPATLPAPRDVGEQVHIDLVVLEDGLRQGHYVVHVVDAVSRYQAAAVIETRARPVFVGFFYITGSRSWVHLEW